MEILVVVAIIAVLAALAFPMMGRVTQAARSAECMSNLKQVGAAINMYAVDNNGKLPPLQPPIDSETGKRGDIWPGLVAREGYMWDFQGDLPCGTGMWTCPSCDFMSDAYGGYGVVENTVFVYGERRPEGGVREEGSLRTSLIDDPANTWLVGDAAQKADELNKGWYAIWPRPSQWSNHCPAERHGGRLNVCMVDGHVETMTMKDVEERKLTVDVVR